MREGIRNRVVTLAVLAGLPVPSLVLAQGPLSEPFPATLDLDSLDGTAGFRAANDRDGRAGGFVGPAGDLNHDGIDDFVVVETGLAAAMGNVCVVFGRPAGAPPFPATLDLGALDGTNGFVFDTVGRAYAITARNAGDPNADGIDDLLIAKDGPVFPENSAYVVYGRDVAASGAFGSTIAPGDLDGRSGFRLEHSGGLLDGNQGLGAAGVGDVNGDGVDDIAIGNPRVDGDITFSPGATFVVFGKAAGADPFPAVLDLATLDGATGFRFDGTSPGEYSGSAVASAGDLNGDGLGDLLVGAWRATPSVGGSGNVYVVFGRDAASDPFPERFSVAALDTWNGFIISAGSPNSRVGRDVARAGDVNGDGLDDIVIGAAGSCSGTGRPYNCHGRAFVVFGRETAAVGRFPYRLTLAGLDGTDGFALDGIDHEDRTGISVSGGGDLNGDGIDDLAIGSELWRRGGVDDRKGRADVVFGRDTTAGGMFPPVISLGDLDGSIGFSATGLARRDCAGCSLAFAGDANGDGIDDLIVGAREVAVGPHDNAGVAYVIYGRDLASCPADLDGDGALTIFDFLAFGNLFDLMDPAADFDGDGEFTIFDFLAFQNAFDAGCP